MPVTTEDYVAISDHLGRYCWAFDDGEAETYAALWAPDGIFTGVTEHPVVGHEALRELVRAAQERAGGKIRHMVANLVCDYGDTKDIVQANYYNFVTLWTGGGSFRTMALCKVKLARAGRGWLIERNDTVLFPG